MGDLKDTREVSFEIVGTNREEESYALIDDGDQSEPGCGPGCCKSVFSWTEASTQAAMC